MSKMSMKWRMVLPIGIILALGIMAIVVFIIINFSSITTKMANDQIEASSYRYANSIKGDFDRSFSAVSALASAISVEAGSETANRVDSTAVLAKALEDNTDFFGLWMCFEPNTFDGKDAAFVNQPPEGDGGGRYAPYVFRGSNGGNALQSEALVGYDVPGDGDYYLKARDSGRSNMTTPFFYEAGGKTIFVTSMAVPIKKNGKVLGAIGGDLVVDDIAERVLGIKMYQTGYAYLLDHDGIVVSHPNKDLVLKPIYDYIDADFASAVRNAYQDGQARILQSSSRITGIRGTFAVCPLQISDTGSKWVLVLSAPQDEVMAEVNRGVMLIILAGIALLVVSTLVLYLLIGRTANAINNISEHTTFASESVLDAAKSIAEASSSLAQGSSSQAAAIEEISSSLEQMASMTRQNADNATKTSDTTRDNNESIGKGSIAVQDMTSAMGSISESANQIHYIIKTIEDIAFQTNLLALNAAVEAARAGEAGKGFAVVADEVRNLAQRSAASASETTSLIETTVGRIKNGVQIAERLGDCFKNIETGSNTVARLITEISTATNEQSLGVDQINTAVAQLDKVTQNNAADADTMARSASDLNTQSDTLNEQVSSLSLLVGGASAGNGGTPQRKMLMLTTSSK